MENTDNTEKYNIVLEGVENTNPYEELIKVFLRPDQYVITNRADASNTDTSKADAGNADDSTTETDLNDPGSQYDPGSQNDEKKDFDETLVFADNEDKDVTRRQIFECLSERTGIVPKWGIMTGIRPVKLYGMLMDEFAGKGEFSEKTEEVNHCFRNHYLVSKEKTELAGELFAYQMETFGEAEDNSCGVYIGIPFCPTRCLYCAFASNPADDEMIKNYLKALHREIEYCGRAMREKGLYAESIYVGGGTPTTLSAKQLDELLQHVTEAIPMQHDTKAIPVMDRDTKDTSDLNRNQDTEEVESKEDGRRGLKEFTVEAGRPDTITGDKIKAMLAHGVDRISINPQTMNPETLKTIGRDHTPEDVRAAFEIVRRAEEEYWSQKAEEEPGDKSIASEPQITEEMKSSKLIINTDLIAGLPGEDVSDMENTIREMIELGADNITVHSLAVKRASRLSEEDKDYHYSHGDVVSRMLERARKMLSESAYRPYYLYRQKHMSGAQENTGYCKEGTASIYNVRIMDEHQRIIAMGAGGISKAYDPETRTLQRVPNVTNQEIYTERIHEMIQRKEDKLFV